MNSFFIEKFYLFFEGIMLFQVVFFAMVYIITQRRDVLYYSLLNLVSASYFFLNAPDTFLGIQENIVFDSPFYLYFNFALFLLMIFLYLIFLKEIFSETLIEYPYLKNIYTITFYSIPLLYILFVLFALLGWETNAIFYTGHIINGPFCTLILILNFRKKGYKSLIIIGMLVVFVCVVITMVLTIRYNAGSNDTVIDRYPLAIIKLGMLVDIILFQLALLKRWNEYEKQLAIEKIQSQLSLEKLRNKISGELHDDIGSTLSGVSMYSHLTNKQITNGELENAKASLKIIQKSTDEMVDKLGDLVWSVNPEVDSLKSLFDRIDQFALQICAVKNIQFIIRVPQNIEGQELSPERMHHLYLVVKEAVNNAVKYSNAKNLTIDIVFKNGLLKLSVMDNGKGFEPSCIRSGNGLNNIKKRIEEIGGILHIQTEIDKGSTISVIVKYPNEV